MKKMLRPIGLLGGLMMMLGMVGPAHADGPLGTIAIAAPFECEITIIFPQKEKLNTDEQCVGLATPTGTYTVNGQVDAIAPLPATLEVYNIQYQEVGGLAAGFANGHFHVHATATCLLSCGAKPAGTFPITIHGTFDWTRVGLSAVVTIPAKKAVKGGNVATHVHFGHLAKHKSKAGAKVSCALGDPQSVGAAAFVPLSVPNQEKPGAPLTVVIAGTVTGACVH